MTDDLGTLTAADWAAFCQQTGGVPVAWPFVDDGHVGATAGRWTLAAWRLASTQGNLPVRGDGVRAAPDGASVYVTAEAIGQMALDPSMRMTVIGAPGGAIPTVVYYAAALVILWALVNDHA